MWPRLWRKDWVGWWLVAFWIEGGCEGGRCALVVAAGDTLGIVIQSWQDEGWSGQGTPFVGERASGQVIGGGRSDCAKL